MAEDIAEAPKPALQNIFPPDELHPGGKSLEKPFVYSSFLQLAEKGSPPGKRMLVIGSGANTALWQNKGAKTLDIDPQWKADFVADANNLVKATGENAFDIILAESVTVDPKGEKGVNFAQMVKQAIQALKPNGELYIQTATVGSLPEENWPIPDPKAAMQIMINAGLRSVAVYRGMLVTTSEDWKVVGDKTIISDFYHDALAIYYGRKPNPNL